MQIEIIEQRRLRASPHAVFALALDAERFPAFPSIQQPALVLHGRNDTVVPSQLSEEFTAMKPNRKLVLQDSGHELIEVLDQLWCETAQFLGFSDSLVGYRFS